MTTVLIRKGPVFLMEGSNPNMDDKQVPTYTLYASRILLWCIRYMMLQNISCILQSQDKKKGLIHHKTSKQKIIQDSKKKGPNGLITIPTHNGICCPVSLSLPQWWQ